ncbi:hypothetical protein ACHAW6_012147 [Cyclotella cf. meneghiniana]
MEIQERSSGKIYSLSSAATLPEWLSDRSKRNLSKRDSAYRHRITLLQDLEMPVSSSKIRQSPDGRYLVVGGTYAPRIRCYELQEMSMKFERYLDSEVVDLLVLGEDYGKLAILGNDRSVSFHAPYGFHASIRLPTFGRAMAYEKSTCDLLVVSSGKRGGDVDVAGRSTGQVYRFNLDEGRFSQTLSYDSALRTKSFEEGRTLQLGGSCIAVSPTHSLTAIGAEDGTVRFWDNRVPVGSSHDDVHLTPFLNLDVASATAGFGFFDDSTNIGFSGEVTSICFNSSGVHMCAGTKGGNVALYDMRSSKPLFIKEHQYGLPIHTVQFHDGSGAVLSSDAKLVKIWNAKGSASSGMQRTDDWNEGPAIGKGINSDGVGGAIGSIVANVEGTADFTHFLVAGDSSDTSGHNSGLLLCTGEQSKVQSFYCPMLGPAPKWCSFLDNITEELEEKDGALDKSAGASDGIVQTETIYEDYKFLTRTEIDQLGIQNLVGTPLLRGYMHGFFIHVGLYNRIRAVAKPFEYSEYRTQKIKQRMEEKRASRIAPKTNPNEKKISAKVNPELAERLQNKASDRTKAGKVAKALVEDDRFGSLFSNPDFEIDEEAEDFKLRNPSGVAATKVRNDRDMDSDQDDGDLSDEGEDSESNVMQDEEDWGHDSEQDDVDYSSESEEEDGFRGGKVRGEAYESIKSKPRTQSKQNGSKGKQSKTKSKHKMYDDSEHAVDIGLGRVSAEEEAAKRKKELSLSMAERLQLRSEESKFMGETKRLKVRGQGTVKEVTFIPKSSLKKKEEEAIKQVKDDRTGRSRRGIKELGFRTPFKHHKK